MPFDLVAGGLDVGLVDHAGVDLAELDLGQHRLDVGSEGDRRDRELRRRRRPAGRRRRTAPPPGTAHLDVRLGQVGERGSTPAGLSGGTAICMTFLRERRRVARRRRPSTTASMFFGARRGEDVGRRALGDLLGQRRAGGEVEPDRRRPGARPRTACPASPNDSVSDAAANTVTVPDRLPLDPLPGAGVGGRVAVAAPGQDAARPRPGRPPAASSASSSLRHLHHDVGRLHRGHGEHAGLEPELVGRLPAHQRHHPERCRPGSRPGPSRRPGRPG